jgi:hypothetical protein
LVRVSQKACSRSAKYPARQVMTTSNRNVIEAFYRKTDGEASLDPGQCAVGVVQHPATGLYQTWLSTNGLDIVCLSAHRRLMRAEVVQGELKIFLQSGDLYQEDKAAAFFAQLQEESDEEPRPLPDDLVRFIARSIMRALIDHP